MIFILFALIIFAFLFLGAVVFVVCVILPPTRGYALSAALWWAVWGPCVVGLLTLAGLGLIGTAIAKEHTHLQQFEHLPSAIGPTYAIVGVIGTIAIASLLAWLHQLLIHRMTFFLFRIYACIVLAGIGSVWGWAFNFWLLGKGLFPLGFVVLPLLCLTFGYVGFRYARQLRCSAPQNLTWITPEEFEGNV